MSRWKNGGKYVDAWWVYRRLSRLRNIAATSLGAELLGGGSGDHIKRTEGAGGADKEIIMAFSGNGSAALAWKIGKIIFSFRITDSAVAGRR